MDYNLNNLSPENKEFATRLARLYKIIKERSEDFDESHKITNELYERIKGIFPYLSTPTKDLIDELKFQVKSLRTCLDAFLIIDELYWDLLRRQASQPPDTDNEIPPLFSLN